MPKSKWGDAEKPTIINFYKIGNIWFVIWSFKCESMQWFLHIIYLYIILSLSFTNFSNLNERQANDNENNRESMDEILML